MRVAARSSRLGRKRPCNCEQIFGAAWPNLAEARWESLARRSYRSNAAGLLEPDADPLIGEVVRNSASAGRDLWQLWSGLRQVPVLALRGELSDLLSMQTLERMQSEKPDLQTAVIPERGHTPLLDEPESLSRINSKWCSLQALNFAFYVLLCW